MNDLFRTEAVEYQQHKLLGTIILRQAWSTLALTLFFGVLTGALIAVFFLFGFARRETLTGRWLPEGGLIQASSVQPGLVQDVRAREGQQVRQGELLFVLSGEREGVRGSTHGRVGMALSEQRDMLGEEIGRAQRQADLSRSALAGRLRQAEIQLIQLRAGIVLQRRRTGVAEAALQHFASPEYAMVVSREKLDEKRVGLIDQELILHAMLREEASAVAERDTLRAELDAMPVRTQREVAGIQGRLNSVRQSEAENDTRRQWEVRAPRAGHLTFVNAEPGQSVTAGEVLASIAPEGAVLEAVLYAPSRAAGQIKAGMPAQLRFDALPHQKYGQFAAEVREVSRSPVPPGGQGISAAPGHAGTPMYRVRVRLRPQQLAADRAAALRAGMQLDGTLTLEHRRFYEWVLEPLLGARAALP